MLAATSSDRGNECHEFFLLVLGNGDDVVIFQDNIGSILAHVLLQEAEVDNVGSVGTVEMVL